jgi:hypothetical protein
MRYCWKALGAPPRDGQPTLDTKELTMRLIKLTSTAILAMLALAVAIPATASAEKQPNILPQGTGASPLTATSKSGESKFGNGLLAATSTKSTGSLSDNAEKLGTYDLLFEGFRDALGRTCTGLEDKESGSVLFLGTFHVRDAKVGTELDVVLINLFKPVHFTCGTTLIVEFGCVVIRLTPAGTLAKSLTDTLTKEGSDDTIIKVLNEENTAEENCELLAAENEKSASLTSFASTLTIEGFKKGGVAVEVLVMPL